MRLFLLGFYAVIFTANTFAQTIPNTVLQDRGALPSAFLGYSTNQLNTGIFWNATSRPSTALGEGMVLFQNVYPSNFYSLSLYSDLNAEDLYINTGIYGAAGANWQGWQKFLSSKNFSSYALALTGGTVNGGVNNSSNKTFQVASPDGHNIFLNSSLGLGNYNPIVQAGDQGLIFSAGTQGTGSFCIAPWAAATSGIRMLTSGNVLIGKSSQVNSAYILDVNGPVRANQVTVNTTGADFVFEPGYKLAPLNQVLAFIQANHHLPGIAPAAQMQKEGVDVGDNQTKLLQKIEELTLYVIEQNKRIEEQHKENETLQKAFSQQQALLEKLQNEIKMSKK